MNNNRKIYFYEKNIYTIVNADKLPIGSEVICCDNLKDLYIKINNINESSGTDVNENLWNNIVLTVISIRDISHTNRFLCNDGKCYNIAYFVSCFDESLLPEEYYVPYKREDCPLVLKDVVIQKKSLTPFIITDFKYKKNTGLWYITAGDKDFTFKQLFDLFILKNWKPCGNLVMNE
jgi:hypothetical protein